MIKPRYKASQGHKDGGKGSTSWWYELQNILRHFVIYRTWLIDKEYNEEVVTTAITVGDFPLLEFLIPRICVLPSISINQHQLQVLIQQYPTRSNKHAVLSQQTEQPVSSFVRSGLLDFSYCQICWRA
jgi:hypothetical protein